MLGVAGLNAAGGNEELAVAEQEERVVRLGVQRALQQCLSRAPAFERAFECGQHCVSLAGAWIEANGALGGFAGVLDQPRAAISGEAQHF